MLRMSRGVFRRVAQQLFRNHTRVLEFGLRLRLIALEKMNVSLQERLRDGAVVSTINVSRGIFARRQGLRETSVVTSGPKISPKSPDHSDRQSPGKGAICFSATVRSPLRQHPPGMLSTPTVAERLRRYGDRAIKSLVGGLELRKAM